MTGHLSRRDTLAATAGVATAMLAGCVSDMGDDGSSGAEQPEDVGELGTPAEELTIKIRSEPWPEFDPQIVHVTPGATVKWLVETGRHDVTGYHEDSHPPHHSPVGAEPWESDFLTGPGSTYERTFETEGVYDYVDTQEVCVSHEVAGNVGRIVVGWPDPGAEPAMEPLSEGQLSDLPSQVANAFEWFDEETRPVLEAGPG